MRLAVVVLAAAAACTPTTEPLSNNAGVGAACATDGDCGDPLVCLHPLFQGCIVVGSCFDPSADGGLHCQPAQAACTCEGNVQEVQVCGNWVKPLSILNFGPCTDASPFPADSPSE